MVAPFVRQVRSPACRVPQRLGSCAPDRYPLPGLAGTIDITGMGVIKSGEARLSWNDGCVE